MENTNNKYKDRTIDGLPEDKELVYIWLEPEQIEVEALWEQYDPKDYEETQPVKGYLGTFTAKVDSIPIGFHVWQQNDFEIRYWRKIDQNGD